MVYTQTLGEERLSSTITSVAEALQAEFPSFPLGTRYSPELAPILRIAVDPPPTKDGRWVLQCLALIEQRAAIWLPQGWLVLAGLTSRAIARDPNSRAYALERAALLYPDDVLANPSLPLLRFENPNFLLWL